MPVGCLFIGMAHLADRRLIEGQAGDLEADRQPVRIKTARHLKSR